MDNKFIKFIKTNVIIIVPSFVIVSLLTGFMIFGISRPDTTVIYTKYDITIQQQLQEERFLDVYEEDSHNESNPFFVLNPFEVSPLTGLLVFETDTEQQFEIVVKGKVSEADMSFVSSKSMTHFIPVYGLYADYNNTVELYSYSNQGRGTLLSTTNIQTEPLPDGVSLPTSLDTTFDYFGTDLMILIPAMKSLPVGYDYNGDIRWYLTSNYSWAPTLLENGHLLLGTDRLINDPYYVTGLYEIDYLGKIYREYKIPGGYHHDVVELPNTNLLVLTDDFQGTVEDKVVEIERNTGEIVDTWDLKDYIDTLDGMSQMWTTFDWFHNNSVDYDPKTDSILLSGRHQDIVVSIGKTSKELNYVIGDPNQWSQSFVDEFFLTPTGDEFEWQYAQHSAMYLPNGNIFLFDNGNNKSKFTESSVVASQSYSRGVIYSIDESNKTIEQVYQFGKELGSAFYSPYISNVDFYADGHYMIHSGGHGEYENEVLNIPGPLHEFVTDVNYKSMTYEVQDDVVKYYLEVQDNFYRAKRVSLYTEHTAYRTGKGLVLGNLAETKQFTGEYQVRFNLLDTVPPRFELELTKESDRLVLDIILDRTDEIYLVLVNSNTRLEYKVPTSETPYTAMCTATFQGEERHITYFINETNLSGGFDIYVVINGREYHTYKYVEFNE